MKKRILMLGFTCAEYGSELLQLFQQNDFVPVEETFMSHVSLQALSSVQLPELAALVKMHNCEAVMTCPTVSLLGQVAENGLKGNISLWGVATKVVNREDLPEDVLGYVDQQNTIRAQHNSFGMMPSMGQGGVMFMRTIGGHEPQPAYGGGFQRTDYSHAGATVNVLDMVQIGSFNA